MSSALWVFSMALPQLILHIVLNTAWKPKDDQGMWGMWWWQWHQLYCRWCLPLWDFVASGWQFRWVWDWCKVFCGEATDDVIDTQIPDQPEQESDDSYIANIKSSTTTRLARRAISTVATVHIGSATLAEIRFNIRSRLQTAEEIGINNLFRLLRVFTMQAVSEVVWSWTDNFVHSQKHHLGFSS